MHWWKDTMNGDPRSILDLSALGLIVGTVLEVLPTMAAILSILWFIVRIVESRLFRALLRSATGWDIDVWLGAPRGKE